MQHLASILLVLAALVSSIAISLPIWASHDDKKSGDYRLSHHLDLKTGTYKGRQVLDPKE